ncbi:MAG TPA: BON domain-containing protein [Myxococcota bacterium]|nr:BON domain-containing protein [Myxococcota bacterium]
MTTIIEARRSGRCRILVPCLVTALALVLGGGRAVADAAGPAGALRARVVERLAASRSLMGADIHVGVVGRRVILEGYVQDERTAQRAEGISRRTRGVRAVTSRLEIDTARAGRADVSVRDEQLAERIAHTLVEKLFPDARPEKEWRYGWEVEGASWEMDVDVDMGDVTLSGTAPSWDDLERAIETTRKVPGVRSVHSELGFIDPALWAMHASAAPLRASGEAP